MSSVKPEERRVLRVFLATLVVMLFITSLTIAAEISPALKDWLKVSFSHHWVGKSVLAIALFALISFFGPVIDRATLQHWLLPVLVLSTVSLFVFFVLHFLRIIG